MFPEDHPNYRKIIIIMKNIQKIDDLLLLWVQTIIFVPIVLIAI